VQGGPWLLAGRVFRNPQLTAHPHLILVLHGDAPFVNPTYQYVFAESAAQALQNVVAVALLRPGYRDAQGERSQGSRGLTTADNYTSDRIVSIAAAARSLVARYHASDLTLVGHSGGSAIAADILELYPHLAARALLVSCPCDVAAFRWSMFKSQWNPMWLLPVASISPIDHVSSIPRHIVIRMVTGSADDIAPPALTFAFASALKQKGVDVRVIELKNKGHEILLEPAVIDQLRALLDAKPPAAD